MQIEPYIIISDCHNLFSHICPFRKIICFCQILYIFCEIVFSFTKKFYYLLPHQFCKSLSGAKQVIKAQLKYVFSSNKLLTNARFKPFPRLFKIPSIENRHRTPPVNERFRCLHTSFFVPDSAGSYPLKSWRKAGQLRFLP